MSGKLGPIGQSGYNGSKGPTGTPGPRGPPGLPEPGSLSSCAYKTGNSGRVTAGDAAVTDVQAKETKVRPSAFNARVTHVSLSA